MQQSLVIHHRISHVQAFRSCDLEILERNKNVTLTRRLLPAAEVVAVRLNEWSKKLTDRPSDRQNNKQRLH